VATDDHSRKTEQAIEQTAPLSRSRRSEDDKFN